MRCLLLSWCLLPACGRPLVGLVPIPDAGDADSPLPEAEEDAGVADAEPDVELLLILNTNPPNGFLGAAINATVSASLKQPLEPTSVNTMSVRVTQDGMRVAGQAVYQLGKVIFDPDKSMAPFKECTALLTKDIQGRLAGQVLESDYSWTFTTGANIEPPAVTSAIPRNAAINVRDNRTLVVAFSRRMKPTSITGSTFTVREGMALVPGIVTYQEDSWTASFTAARRFTSLSTFQATISSAVTDRGGTALDSSFVWTFRTGPCTQDPINLESARRFAVFAGKEVMSSGVTRIIGDVGVSPGTVITGFPPGKISDGDLYVADAVATAAAPALAKAYGDATGQSMCPVNLEGDLGGKTLGPGLYVSKGPLVIAAGDLTIDGQEDDGTSFVFQVASTLRIGSGRKIILASSANPSNLFWQVGQSAVIGPGSSFAGNIIADGDITMGSDATLSGRLLSLKGTIKLDSNNITR